MLIKNDSSKIEVFYALKISSETEEIKHIPLEMDEIVLGGGSDVDISISSVPQKILQFTRSSQGYSVKSFSSEVLWNEQKIEKILPFSTEDILSMNGFVFELIRTTKAEEENEKKKREAELNPPDSSKTQFLEVITVKELETKGRFVGVSGSVKGRVFEFIKDKLSVGRDSSNDVCVESDGLSRAHAVIEVGDEFLTVMDFNSTNGTFVNGKKVVSDTVKPGSIIQFANAGFRYEGPKGAGKETEKLTRDSKHTVRMVIFVMVICLIVGGGFLIGYYILTQKQKKATEELAVKKKEIETLTLISTPIEKDLSVAKQALASEQYGEAIAIIDGILQKYPGDPSAVLLKGKIEKQQKIFDLKSVFEKGSRYFKNNDFERAKQTLSSIESDFPQYDVVKAMLQQLEQLSVVDPAYNQALKDFNEGKLDTVHNALEFIFKRFPGYKKAQALKVQVDILDSCFQSINNTKADGNLEELTHSFELILKTVPNEDNFFHQLSKKKLKELKTGKNIKTETLYASAIALLADRNYGAAYELLKKALNLSPDQIKIKIVFSEVKKQREKMLEQWNKIAIALDTQDPSNPTDSADSVGAKLFRKKIIDSGSEDNVYYQAAIEKIEQQG